MEIQATKNALRFGYVTWQKVEDQSVRALLGDLQYATVTFFGEDIGERRIDWKYRRISIGSTITTVLRARAGSKFILTRKGNVLNVDFK